jgi:L-threonylcarbamoyladenylate synthase
MDKTKNNKIGNDINLAARLLGQDGIVGIPTETVYGLAGNAYSGHAVAKIFAAKQRPWFDPLIAHTSDLERVTEFADWTDDRLLALAKHFWPGPLTLICKRKSKIADLVSSGLSTVGVRVPAHPMSLELLRRIEFPLAAPSANLFGRVSPTTAQHVADQLVNKIDFILDGGPCRVGIESTVVSAENGLIKILRPGGITRESIESVIGPVEVGTAVIDQNMGLQSSGAHQSPGMIESHYAPKTKLIVADSTQAHELKDLRVGYIGLNAPKTPQFFAAIESLSPRSDLAEAASGFFAALRRLDERELDVIVAELFPKHGLGIALNDRLMRAAAKRS